MPQSTNVWTTSDSRRPSRSSNPTSHQSPGQRRRPLNYIDMLIYFMDIDNIDYDIDVVNTTKNIELTKTTTSFFSVCFCGFIETL